MPGKKRKNVEEQELQWEVGTFVWARTTRTGPWWPGLTINHLDGGFKAPKAKNVWVFWFGDHRATEVSLKNMSSFDESFKENYKQHLKSKKVWMQGVLEAIKEYGPKEAINWSNNQLLAWASSGFYKNRKSRNMERRGDGIPYFVKQKLDYIKSQNLKSDKCLERSYVIKDEKEYLDKIKRREISLDDICICCYSGELEDEHPYFHGKICKNCKERLTNTIFVVGDDNIAYYCTICATLGEMVVCDAKECGRSFCKKCLDIFSNPGTTGYIKKLKKWLCFICEPQNVRRVSDLLDVRKDWYKRIHAMFDGTQSQIVSIPKFTAKRKLRVLSLFDGIGTGLLALDNLQLQVEKYYTAEIDKDALSIVRINHGDRISNLGDIRHLSHESIKELCPIDLLIGGSPCNDLSFVNPNRKGLYDVSGSGILFFDFYRILMTLNSINGVPFFWLYENVAAMPAEYKALISRFLKCKPKLCDSIHLSAHKRARLFWGNLPSLCQKELHVEGPTLQKYLLPGRIATLSKVRCLTTARNSLEKGAVVNEDGTPDVIWITEIEKLFGFPAHYTDTGNLSLQKRQQLIGRSWSVDVITNLFRFLCHFFPTNI